VLVDPVLRTPQRVIVRQDNPDTVPFGGQFKPVPDDPRADRS